MKLRNILTCLVLGCLSFSLYAQDEQEEAYVWDKKEKSFRFVYIAHDVNTPVSRLSERLKNIRNDAAEGGEDVIFYLASGSNPIVVEYNVGKDNKTDFDEVLLAELNERNSHDVDPETDVDAIFELLDNVDFADENHRLKYGSVKFNFFVNPKFWTLKNNESIIVPVYFCFDVPKLTGGRVQFQIMEAREDRLPEGNLFGEKDVEGINKFTATDRVIY